MITHIIDILKNNKPRDALPLLNLLTTKHNQDLYVDTDYVTDTILVAVISRIYTVLKIKGTVPVCILKTLNKEDKNLRFIAEYFFSNLENADKMIRLVIENIIQDYTYDESENSNESNGNESSNSENSNENENRNSENSNSESRDENVVDENINTNSTSNVTRSNVTCNTKNNKYETKDIESNTTLILIDDVDKKELNTFENALTKLFKNTKHNKINAVQRKVKILEILITKHKTRDLKIMKDLFCISEILEEKEISNVHKNNIYKKNIYKNNVNKNTINANNVSRQCKLLKLYFTNLKNPQKINKYFFRCLTNHSAVKYVNLVIKKCEEYKIKFEYHEFLKKCKTNTHFIDATKIPFKYLIRVSTKKRYEKLVKSAIRNMKDKKELEKGLYKINKKRTTSSKVRIIKYIEKYINKI